MFQNVYKPHNKYAYNGLESFVLKSQDHTARISVGILSKQKSDLNETIGNKSSAIKKLSRKR